MASTQGYTYHRAQGKPKPFTDSQPIVAVTVVFSLSPAEARLLPAQNKMPRTFGAAQSYESSVRRTGGELIVRYRATDNPFEASDPRDIPRLALRHVNQVLKKLAEGK